MTCTAPATSGDMFLCLLVGGVVPYFIIAVLATAGGIITNEVLKA
jgi:hypothetical protein